MKVELLQTFITGHPEIDAEHTKIVNAINDVSDAISTARYDRCATLLDDFLKICVDHFDHEERLLAELGYPQLDDHIVFHKELLIKAKAVKSLCMDMHSPESIQHCFDEMATLLIEDVVKGDMQFVSFLIENDIVDHRQHKHPIPKHTPPSTTNT